MSATSKRVQQEQLARDTADLLAALREIASGEGTTAAALGSWIGLPVHRVGVLLSDAARDGRCRKVRRGDLWLYQSVPSALSSEGSVDGSAVRAGKLSVAARSARLPLPSAQAAHAKSVRRTAAGDRPVRTIPQLALFVCGCGFSAKVAQTWVFERVLHTCFVTESV